MSGDNIKNIRTVDKLDGEENPYILIRKTIITYYVISNIKSLHPDLFWPAYMFENGMNIIGKMDAKYFTLFDTKNFPSISNCKSLLDVSNKFKPFSTELCTDCSEDIKDIDTVVSSFKYALQDVGISPLPMCLQTALIILVVVIIFIISYIVDFIALKQLATNNTQSGMGMGMGGIAQQQQQYM